MDTQKSKIKICNYAFTPIHNRFFVQHQNSIIEKIADYLTIHLFFE